MNRNRRTVDYFITDPTERAVLERWDMPLDSSLEIVEADDKSVTLKGISTSSGNQVELRIPDDPRSPLSAYLFGRVEAPFNHIIHDRDGMIRKASKRVGVHHDNVGSPGPLPCQVEYHDEGNGAYRLATARWALSDKSRVSGLAVDQTGSASLQQVAPGLYSLNVPANQQTPPVEGSLAALQKLALRCEQNLTLPPEAAPMLPATGAEAALANLFGGAVRTSSLAADGRDVSPRPSAGPSVNPSPIPEMPS